MRLKLLTLIILILFSPLSVKAEGVFVHAQEVSSAIREFAILNRIDPEYLLAVGEVESRLNPYAVGRAGERGPLQVLPSTFRALGGRRLGDWRETTAVATRYFARCLRLAGGNYELATTYYNAGEGNVHHRSIRYAVKVSRHYTRRLSLRSGPAYFQSGLQYRVP
jgi:soluble lytic murein transglycosylase-like protein